MKKLYKGTASKKDCYQQKNVNDNSNRNKKKRHRKVPKVPNLGKEFFELLKRHFPKQQNMFKIFNKNTVKLR